MNREEVFNNVKDSLNPKTGSEETIYTYIYKDTIDLQFCGWSITLLKDGTYFINDTTGG